MSDNLFPDWVTDKDLHDALHHVWAAFDPRHPNYAPAFQRGALIIVKELLGVDVSAEVEAHEADVLQELDSIFPGEDSQ